MIDETVLAQAHKEDYTKNYFESTQKTAVKQYSDRDKNGKPIETINDIIWRVATTLAIAELRYVLTANQIVSLAIEQALVHPTVIQWSKTFADFIGNQYFWMNTPGNINSNPEIALKVLQYQAYGELAEMGYDAIWNTEEHIHFFKNDLADTDYQKAKWNMGRIAVEINGKGCLAACGVMYAEDSLVGIHKAAQVEAEAAKNSMGMGLNTSAIRPWNSVVSNGAAASGPDRFYEKTIASAVAAVAQGGRRGGALIELRNSDHPDILFFIEKKKLIPHPKRSDFKTDEEYGMAYFKYMERQNYLKNTNISILAMPGFMDAVQNKRWYSATFDKKRWKGKLYDPRKPLMAVDNKGKQYHVQDENTKEFLFEEYSVDYDKYPEAAFGIVLPAQSLNHCFYAPEVFDRIIEGMRDSGEPGIIFYDLVNAANANAHAYDLNTCNPCGEQQLPVGPGKDGRFYMGICNLSSLHAAHPTFFQNDAVDYLFERMQGVAEIQLRAMDNVVDISWFPFAQQNLTARLERRTGGGFAGVAEYLARRELRFGSPEACVAVTDLFHAYTEAMVKASTELAKERGVYPLWEGSTYQKKNLKVRNSCMANNAPTGTLAQMLQTSWGVEPFDGIVFSRKVRTSVVDFTAPGFEDAMKKQGEWSDEEQWQSVLKQTIRDNNKSVKNLGEILGAPAAFRVPKVVQESFPIRREIAPEQYINHLAAVYKGCSAYPETFNAVSNTCAIESNTDLKVVREAVMQAYKMGVKALTFYPDASRISQPIEQIAKAPPKFFELKSTITVPSASALFASRSETEIDTSQTVGTTYKVKVGTPDGPGTLHVTLNRDLASNSLVEVYVRQGKAGGVVSGLCEAIGRIISAFLQFAAMKGQRAEAEGIIIKQLIGIESGFTAWHKWPDKEKPDTMLSICDALAKTIQRHSNSNNGMLEAVKKFGYSEFVDAKEMLKDITVTTPEVERQLYCKECGSECIKIEGCSVCTACGSSKCG